MINPICVVVLAGGEGSRIGGDKPLRRLGGESLVARAVKLAQRWSQEVRIAVRSVGQSVEPGIPLLFDDPDIPGPLAGLASALRHARSRNYGSALTLPCDMPFLPEDLLARLVDAIGDNMAAVAASGGEIHPVCALWRADAFDGIEPYVCRGRRSLRGFASEVGFAVAEWSADPTDPFFNINEEKDLRFAERLLNS